MSKSVSVPVRVVVSLAAAAVVLAAYVSSDDGGVTAVATEAVSSSTVPTDGADPGTPDLEAPWGDHDSRGELLALGSPSTLLVRTGADPAAGTAISATPAADGEPAASTAPSSPAAAAPPTTTPIPEAVSVSSRPLSAGATATTAPAPAPAPATSRTTSGPIPTAAPTTRSDPADPAAACTGGERFQRVFRDDFNGSSVGSAWRQYDSIGNNGFGLRRPSAVSVADGRLFITAGMVEGKLVSGGMAHGYDQKYGKYVVKVRTDHDPSLAVSGVVLTWPQSQVHPRDGENNIYETLVYDADRSPFYSVIHKPFGGHSDHVLHVQNADGSRFQTMTMEWTPESITIIREGPGGANSTERWTQPETAENLIPDVAHHVTIQLDAWKHSMVGTVRMEVDFIEVYRYCG